MSPEELWDRVRQCFERDDGSLPTIELQSLTASEIAGIYSLIREQSRVVSQDATFWDVRAAADRALEPHSARSLHNRRAAVKVDAGQERGYDEGTPGRSPGVARSDLDGEWDRRDDQVMIS